MENKDNWFVWEIVSQNNTKHGLYGYTMFQKEDNKIITTPSIWRNEKEVRGNIKDDFLMEHKKFLTYLPFSCTRLNRH